MELKCAYELPIYIEKLDLFELLSRRLPRDICNIIENSRIDAIIIAIKTMKPILPFNVCHIIRYAPNCKLLRSMESIISQLRCGSTIPPRIPHTILFLSPTNVQTCIEYLDAIIQRQECLKRRQEAENRFNSLVRFCPYY